MKNKEKYAKEIIELACNGNNIAVNKVTGKPVKCSECGCNQCVFCENGNCEDSDFGLLSEWAESEYIEKFDAKKLELTRKESDSVIYHDFMKKGRE